MVARSDTTRFGKVLYRIAAILKLQRFSAASKGAFRLETGEELLDILGHSVCGARMIFFVDSNNGDG
jgi:hypothetical protein